MSTSYHNLAHARVYPVPAPALSASDVLARKRAVEARLGAIRLDPSRMDERAALKAENEALGRRLGELRDATKLDNQRRNFAGLGFPLHEAVLDLLDAETVARLEARAFEKLAAREAKSAAKKAAKAAAGGAP
jgi:hypothetical protein